MGKDESLWTKFRASVCIHETIDSRRGLLAFQLLNGSLAFARVVSQARCGNIITVCNSLSYIITSERERERERERESPGHIVIRQSFVSLRLLCTHLASYPLITRGTNAHGVLISCRLSASKNFRYCSSGSASRVARL